LRTLAEIALNLDPSRADRAAHPAMVSTGFVFTPRKLTPQIELVVETSTDLANWVVAATRVAGAQTWTLASPLVALTSNPATGQVTVTFIDSASQRFFRLKATVAP
jgi:hypothetical protein